MPRRPHPVVAVILGALTQTGANVHVARVATERLDVDLQLRAHDGRCITVNIREDN